MNTTEQEFYKKVDKQFAYILSAVDPNLEPRTLDFKKDLNQKGKPGEIFIKNLLELQGMNFNNINDTKTYDLSMQLGDREVKVEVKTDFYIGSKLDRGNIAVEFECRGKESGIKVTESDFWFYYFPKIKQVWRIKTKKLKAIIEGGNYRIHENGGDAGSNTKNFLIPRNIISREFDVYDVSGVFPKKIDL